MYARATGPREQSRHPPGKTTPLAEPTERNPVKVDFQHPHSARRRGRLLRSQPRSHPTLLPKRGRRCRRGAAPPALREAAPDPARNRRTARCGKGAHLAASLLTAQSRALVQLEEVRDATGKGVSGLATRTRSSASIRRWSEPPTRSRCSGCSPNFRATRIILRLLRTLGCAVSSCERDRLSSSSGWRGYRGTAIFTR